MKKSFQILAGTLNLIPFVMVLTTVFIVTNEFVRPAVTGKYFWFYLSMGLMAQTALISQIVNPKKIRLTYTDLLFLLFCCSGILTTSLINNEVTTKLILFILSFLLYFYIRLFLQQKPGYTYILIVVFMITGLAEAIWGLGQLTGLVRSQHPMFSTTGSFFNPGPYAGYLATLIPLACFYILKDWHILERKYSGHFLPFYFRFGLSCVTVFGILTILPATLSRAAWLATAGGCGTVALLYLLRRKHNGKHLFRKHRKKIALAGLAIIVITGIGLTSLYNMKKDSANGRILIWKNSLQLISDHPWGVGLGNFPGHYAAQQAKHFESGLGTEQEELVAGEPEYAFNEYLQIFAELGIISGILFLLLIISVVYTGFKQRKSPVAGSFTALLIFAFMSYPFSLLPFIITFILLLALSDPGNCTPTFSPVLNQKAVRFSSALFLTVAVLCLYNRAPTYHAYKDWNRAKILNRLGKHREALKVYSSIEPYLKDQIRFLSEYSWTLSAEAMYGKSNLILQRAIRISSNPTLHIRMGKNHQKMNDYEQAHICYRQVTRMVPHRIYPYYLIANLCLESGNLEQAKEMARIITAKIPKIDSPAVKEMKNKMELLLHQE